MSTKKIYRVFATMTTDFYLDVEAASRSEAIAIAEETDNGDFIEVKFGGDWSIEDAMEINEPKPSTT